MLPVFISMATYDGNFDLLCSGLDFAEFFSFVWCVWTARNIQTLFLDFHQINVLITTKHSRFFFCFLQLHDAASIRKIITFCERWRPAKSMKCVGVAFDAAKIIKWRVFNSHCSSVFFLLSEDESSINSLWMLSSDWILQSQSWKRRLSFLFPHKKHNTTLK